MKKHAERFLQASKRHFWDCFIPHEGNNHRPKAIRHRALFAYSVILVVVKVALVGAQILLPSASLYSSSVTAPNILELTNASRRSAGIVELAVDERLAAAAQQKAEDMILYQYFAHTSPFGATPWTWINGSGYAYQVAGENLAVHYTEAEDVEAGWLASPTHKANIMDPRFIDTGIGVAHGTFEGFENSVIVVQMFGMPQIATETALVAVEDIPAAVSENLPEPIEASDAATAEPAPADNLAPEIPIAETTPPPAAVTNVVMTSAGINLTVTAPEAQKVEATLGEVRAVLEPTVESGEWNGTVSVASLDKDAGGEEVYVHVDQGQGTETQAAAWVAGSTDSRDVFYVDQGGREFSLFNLFHFGGLEDGVRQFYFLTMAVLSAALLVSILVKFEIQHHSMTAHTLVVILLAGLLAWL